MLFPRGGWLFYSSLFFYDSTFESHNYSWDQVLIIGLGIERPVFK